MKHSFTYKATEKAQKDKEQIAQEYGVPVSAVVWAGGNKYIIVKDGREIRI